MVSRGGERRYFVLNENRGPRIGQGDTGVGVGKPVTVVLNPKSGPERRQTVAERVQELSEGIGHQVRVIATPDLEELCQAAAEALEPGSGGLVVGGGDGTISRVARLVVGSNVPLGILPLGTLN